MVNEVSGGARVLGWDGDDAGCVGLWEAPKGFK